MCEINIDEIKRLLTSDVTSYRISKDTGIPYQSIENYKREGSLVCNMRLYMAMQLQKYINKCKKLND